LAGVETPLGDSSPPGGSHSDFPNFLICIRFIHSIIVGVSSEWRYLKGHLG
jgi:hypothetical protein